MNLFLLVWWWTVYLMYQVTVKSAMLLVYIGFVADGLRRTFGQFGQKVHRVVGPLREYEATYRWDFAFVIAVLMALFVSLLVPHMIGVWLDGKSLEDVKRNRRSLLVFCLGVVLLVADLGLFYNAAVSASWRGTVFSVLALIATCAYGAIVVCVNYFSVVLGEKIDRLSRK